MTVGSLPQNLDGLVRSEEGIRRRELGCSLGRWAGGAVIVVAGGVLIGWWLENPLLKSAVPGLGSMNPLSAICFLLAATSLLLLCTARVTPGCRLLSQAGAAAIVSAALICLTRIYTPWDIGADLLIFGGKVATDVGGLPNRMATGTGASFVLIGSALALMDYRAAGARRPSVWLAGLVGVLALVATFGYVYDARLLYGGRFSLMALNTAICFLVLSLGIVFARPVSFGRTEAGHSRTEQMLRELNDALESRVAERTAELARTNEALLDQTRFLNQVIDTNPQLVFVKDWSGRFTLANRAVADLYGTTVETLIGKTDADFNPNAEEVSAFLEADREVMLKRQVKVIPEEPVTTERAGTARWFHTIKTPLIGRDGSCNRVLGLATDVTARRHAEGELRRASDELRVLFEASPLAMCGLTTDGYVRTWNRAAEQLFGWTAGEVIGRPLPIVPPELDEQHRDLRDRVMAGSPAVNVETFRMRKDGERIDVTVSTALLHDASGAISGVAAVYADMRERKVLEAQLRQAQKMEAVGQLAGGIAHDFNNLLTVIRTASELLLSEIDTHDSRRADVEEIEEAASRAASLTRQLLAFSRQQVLEPRVVDLNHVVTELEPLARRLVEENITVVTRLAADLHPVTADRNQLDQVILNLVVNARDAMPDGGTLLVETSNVAPDDRYPLSHASAGRGSHVLLSVTDTGCGMDADTQARIFEPFFTTKPVGQGTGLGLATVYGIVKQSGGHIWVCSEVGQGSSFKIYLPRGDAQVGYQEHAAPVRRAAPPGENAPATILVVEDDSAVRSAVCRLLERRGYGVVVSQNGRDALAMLAEMEQTVDLVISDIVMPEMSGLELRDHLRELRPMVPVLLMSGYSEEAITRLGNRESLGPLIEKPFTVDGLLDNIRSVLHG